MYTRQHQWKLLDNIRRRSYIKFELKSRLLLSIMGSKSVSLTNRYLAMYRRTSVPRNSSVTRIVNRCIYTGRKYSTLRKYQMSRFSMRFQSYSGALPGVRRHSW